MARRNTNRTRKHTNLGMVGYQAHRLHVDINRHLNFGKALSTTTTEKHKYVEQVIASLKESIQDLRMKERQSASTQNAKLILPLVKLHDGNIPKVRHDINTLISKIESSSDNTASNDAQNDVDTQNSEAGNTQSNPSNDTQNDVDTPNSEVSSVSDNPTSDTQNNVNTSESSSDVSPHRDIYGNPASSDNNSASDSQSQGQHDIYSRN